MWGGREMRSKGGEDTQARGWRRLPGEGGRPMRILGLRRSMAASQMSNSGFFSSAVDGGRDGRLLFPGEHSTAFADDWNTAAALGTGTVAR